MDTKSRNFKPLFAWLAFFMTVNIITFLLISGLGAFAYSGGDWQVLKTPFQYDYRDTHAFQQRTSDYFSNLISMAGSIDSSGNGEQQIIKDRLDQEGSNLLYYAVNQKTGLIVNNFDPALQLTDPEAKPFLPSGYQYYWYFNGEKLQVFDQGKLADIGGMDSGYQSLDDPGFYTGDAGSLTGMRVVLGISDTLQPNPYERSMYYWEQQLLALLAWCYLLLSLAGLICLLYSIFKRHDKYQFDRALATWSGGIWLEVKLFVSLFVLLILGFFAVNISGSGSDIVNALIIIVVLSMAVLAAFWWFYLMLLDIGFNRKSFLGNNLINYVLTQYGKYERKYPWQKMMISRAYVLIGAEAGLALLSVFCLLISSHSGDVFMMLLSFLLAGTGLYLIYRYLGRYNQTIDNLGKLLDHIESIKNGNMGTRLQLAETDDIYTAAQNLNSIQEGMSIAVAEKVRSEHMKVDLITNVSHDLKTPLTSIISYVDLISKEEGLPPHVKDYTTILAQKSARLQNLIHDLFDLSKASSDNIALEVEKIDLARLINQTLADLDEPIGTSGLTFRLSIPEEPVYVFSDGKKLYRVMENLISNTLKYSMLGSRVYIDLSTDEKTARAVIKNTANYEMNFSGEDIVQRFVRGDQSRTTEGSGLGLSIAQSFTQICGGQFTVYVDGDLFKAELVFPRIL